MSIVRVTRWLGVLGVGLSLALVACGDDDGGSGTVDAGGDTSVRPPPPSQTAAERFAASCELRVSMCGDDGADCARQGDCYLAWLVDDAVRAYATCRENCDEGDDACAFEAIGATPRTAAGDAYDEACAGRETECGGFGTGDSPCGPGLGSAIQDTFREASSACLEMPCDMVIDCLAAARPAACGG